MSFLVSLFIYFHLFERQTDGVSGGGHWENETKKYLLSAILLPRCLQWTRQCQVEARSQKLHTGLPRGRSKYLHYSLLFPKVAHSRNWIGKRDRAWSQVLQWEIGGPKWWTNPLCNITAHRLSNREIYAETIQSLRQVSMEIKETECSLPYCFF